MKSLFTAINKNVHNSNSLYNSKFCHGQHNLRSPLFSKFTFIKRDNSSLAVQQSNQNLSQINNDLYSFATKTQYQKLFQTFTKIRVKSDLQMTGKTYEPLLLACKQLGDIELAQEAINDMKSRQIRPTELGLAFFLSILIENGNLHLAIKHFRSYDKQQRFQKDYTFRVIMEGYAKLGDFRGVSEYYTKMISRKIMPKDFSTLIPLFETMAPPIPFSEYQNLYHDAITHFGHSKMIYEHHIDALLRYAFPDEALKFTLEFEKTPITTDIDKQETLISLLTKIMDKFIQNSDMASMQNIVEIYLKLGLPPRPSLFNVMLKKYEMTSKENPENLQKAFKMLDKMKEQNIMPNSESFRIATRAALVANDVSSALKLLEYVKDMGKTPSSQQYVQLINACEYPTVVDILAEEDLMSQMSPMLAFAIFSKYVRFFPNRDISDPLPAELEHIFATLNNSVSQNPYNLETLLVIVSTLGDEERVFEILDHMKKIGYKPNPTNLNFLIKLTVSSRALAHQIFSYFKPLGLVPPPVAYELLLDSCEGNIGEAWLFYTDLKKQSNVRVKAMTKMFIIAESCKSDKAIRYLLDDLDAGVCLLTTPLLMRAAKASVNIKEPERAIKYLQLVKVKGGEVDINLIKDVAKAVIDNGGEETAHAFLKSQAQGLTGEEKLAIEEMLKYENKALN